MSTTPITTEPDRSTTVNWLACIQPKSSLSVAGLKASTGLEPHAQVIVVVVPAAAIALVPADRLWVNCGGNNAETCLTNASISRRTNDSAPVRSCAGDEGRPVPGVRPNSDKNPETTFEGRIAALAACRAGVTALVGTGAVAGVAAATGKS